MADLREQMRAYLDARAAEIERTLAVLVEKLPRLDARMSRLEAVAEAARAHVAAKDLVAFQEAACHIEPYDETRARARDAMRLRAQSERMLREALAALEAT